MSDHVGKGMKLQINRLVLPAILVIFCFQAWGQTKKIANASHSSSGPDFNWTSSDNMGLVRDYDELKRRMPEKIDSSFWMNRKDSCTPKGGEVEGIDTITKAQGSQYEVNSGDNQVPNTVNRKAEKKVRKATRKHNKQIKKEQKTLRKMGENKSSAALKISAEPMQESQSAGIGGWLLLLILPAFYLVFKKS